MNQSMAVQTPAQFPYPHSDVMSAGNCDPAVGELRSPWENSLTRWQPCRRSLDRRLSGSAYHDPMPTVSDSVNDDRTDSEGMALTLAAVGAAVPQPVGVALFQSLVGQPSKLGQISARAFVNSLAHYFTAHRESLAELIHADLPRLPSSSTRSNYE